MSRVNLRTFQQVARERIAELKEDIDALSRVAGSNAAAQAEKARLAVEEELGLALLPDLSDASCARAAQLTGFRGIVVDPPAVAMTTEHAALTARVAEIEADERFQKREHLAHPDTGELTQRRAELLSHKAPITDFVQRCGEHPRFHHLIEVGYDTDAYAVPFWRAAYYQDWKAGDEVVERFPERAPEGRELRFADLRATWLDHQESLSALNTSLHAVNAQLAEVATLTRVHTQSKEALAALPQKHLALWRGRLIGHLRAVGLENLDPAIEAEPSVARLVKALDGLEHKRRYLDAVVTEARELTRVLTEDRHKLGADLAKSQRPKAAGTTYDGAAIEKRFVLRPKKLRSRIQNLTEAHGAVQNYHDWSPARIGHSFLWWDLMTDRRLDGDFIDDVRQHRARADESPQRDDGNAAAAVAGGMAAGVLVAGAADMAFDAS